jgi:hypothetical protein
MSAHHCPSAVVSVVSVVATAGRRPSTDGYFSKRDLFAKQSSVNLVTQTNRIVPRAAPLIPSFTSGQVVQPPTPLSSTEGLNGDPPCYPSSGKRRDSREETLASIMRQRCAVDHQVGT